MRWTALRATRGIALRTGVWAALLVSFLSFCSSPVLAAGRWELQYFYDKNDSSLSFIDLQFPSPSHGVALGRLSEKDHQRSVVLLTSDSGRTWALVPLKDAGLSIFFLNDHTGWLVAQKNRLLKTSDGGRTWTAAPSTGVRAQPLRVFFLDETHGWLLCTQKQVFVTADGGHSWKLVDASRQPSLPEADTVYTWAAFNSSHGLLSGWSRSPEPQSQMPQWMRPDLRALSSRPTTGVLLLSNDGGKSWEPSVLPQSGEIVRIRLTSAGSVLMLLQRPDSLAAPSEISSFSWDTRILSPLYRDKANWVTDFISSGDTLFAAAIDQQGRAPFPAIPSKLKILRSTDLEHWSEMDIDYRAEAQNAFLASPDASHAWVATDTGMILRLVNE